MRVSIAIPAVVSVGPTTSVHLYRPERLTHIPARVAEAELAAKEQ